MIARSILLLNIPDFDTDQAQNGAAQIKLDRQSTSRIAALRWFLRLSIGICIVAFLASRHDNAALLRALRSTSWPVLLGAVAWYWSGQLLSAWKWKLLLRAQNAEVSYADCCRLYAVGMFWNLWMPTNIGGDAVRAVRCGTLCGSRAVAASSILVERLTGLLALAFLGATAFALQIALSPLPRTSATRQIVFLFVLAFTVLCGLSWMLTRARRPSSASSRWTRKWMSLRESLSFYFAPRQRRVLGLAFLLSLVFQASQIVLNIALARALGLEIFPLVFWWLTPALAIASLVPLGIGGLGVREAAAIQMLSVFGASEPTILAWSLLWQVTVWLSSLPGALWAAPPRQP